MDFERLAEAFQAADNRGRRIAEQPLRELHVATAEAYVHLENDQAGSLLYVYDMSAEMFGYADGFITEIECVPPGSELDVVKQIRATLREGRTSIQAQYQRGAAVLQPIARFEM
jgi:hypothetical protein